LRILFEDEARFGRISDRRRCWAPMGERPVVAHQVVREFVYVVGAVEPVHGRITSVIMPWVDAEIMSMFLAHVAAEYPHDHCLVLLDAAGWHIAGHLRIPPTVSLEFLPPYSPELNPMEHVWDHLREDEFGNRCFLSLDAVEQALCSGLRKLDNDPATVSSMTLFDWIKPLAMMSN